MKTENCRRICFLDTTSLKYFEKNKAEKQNGLREIACSMRLKVLIPAIKVTKINRIVWRHIFLYVICGCSFCFHRSTDSPTCLWWERCARLSIVVMVQWRCHLHFLQVSLNFDSAVYCKCCDLCNTFYTCLRNIHTHSIRNQNDENINVSIPRVINLWDFWQGVER